MAMVVVAVAVSANAEPGFVYARFRGSEYDGVSDIWSCPSRTVVRSASMMYVSGYDYYGDAYANSTFAYGCYMFFQGGVTYLFKSHYDDHASLKIDADLVIPKTSLQEEGRGEVCFEQAGWHKVELRVGNGSGYCGMDPGFGWGYVGIYYSMDGGANWERFSLADNGRSSIFSASEEIDFLTAFVCSSSIRENDPTVLDVTYVVYSKKPTVKVRVLAFEDGQRSFAKVVRPETFVDGTCVNVGDNITPNVEHKISWRVSGDWKTKLAKVKFEVLASEGELLPLETMTIPASDQYGKMKITWNAITDSQVFDALLWLYADKDPSLTLSNGVLKNGATELARNGGLSNGTYTWDSGYFDDRVNAARYVLQKMGYSLLTGAPLTYANQETRLGLSPSGARQYGYKIVE